MQENINFDEFLKEEKEKEKKVDKKTILKYVIVLLIYLLGQILLGMIIAAVILVSNITKNNIFVRIDTPTDSIFLKNNLKNSFTILEKNKFENLESFTNNIKKEKIKEDFYMFDFNYKSVDYKVFFNKKNTFLVNNLYTLTEYEPGKFKEKDLKQLELIDVIENNKLIENENINVLTTFKFNKNKNIIFIDKNATSLTNYSLALVNFITLLVITIAVCGILYNVLYSDFLDILKNLKWKYFIYVLVGFGLMFAAAQAANGIQKLLEIISKIQLGDSANQQAIVEMLKGDALLFMVITIVFLAPISEELIFRKSIFGLIKNEKIAYVVSSLVFAFIHITEEAFGIFSGNIGLGFYKLFYNFIGYIIPALALGLIYITSKKNIYVTILTHMLWNTLSIVLIFLL